VSVFNTVTTIPVGGYPGAVAVSPDGSYAYVTNDNTVSVIAL
jgi:DNA-binding beta-propeller fold protein YncE